MPYSEMDTGLLNSNPLGPNSYGTPMPPGGGSGRLASLAIVTVVFAGSAFAGISICNLLLTSTVPPLPASTSLVAKAGPTDIAPA